MNLLVESGMLAELDCGTNFAYVLQNSADFLSTEYKVLQSQTKGTFVKCMKMQINGKVALYYLTSAYRPLSAILTQIDADRFATIVEYLLAGIIEVKNNGFLVCNNIDSTSEHIYIDPNTFKVKLIYTPLNRHEYDDVSGYENAVRTSLIRIIAGYPFLQSPKTSRLSADLQNGTYSIEEVYSRLGGKAVSAESQPDLNSDPGFAEVPRAKGMRIIALNAPSLFELNISKPEFVLGKKETNDGVISFNSMISRVHCKISQFNGQYYLQDLQSSNGTFVNGVRIQPSQSVLLKNGDRIRLANSDFRVEIV